MFKDSDFQAQEETGGAPGENLPSQVWNQQIKFTYNHWPVLLVKGQCLSTKPTRLPSGVACHPDTERIRPCNILWPCQDLNWGPTAQQQELYQCAILLQKMMFPCIYFQIQSCFRSYVHKKILLRRKMGYKNTLKLICVQGSDFSGIYESSLGYIFKIPSHAYHAS